MLRLPLVAALAAVTFTAAGLSSAIPASAVSSVDPPDGIVVKDGVTQPVFPWEESVKDSIYVETPVDSDGDGRRDRVHLTIRRPGPTATGMKVATIVEPSPYWSGILDVPNHGVDVDGLPQRAPSWLAPTGSRRPPALYQLDGGFNQKYYVTRGYAYVEAESIGSGLSDGCPTTGDAQETLGMKAVVDWLTGRARGWDDAGAEARATWSLGSVGMMGGSYNGTLPNQVATTGVAGLKTILPIAAISNWYDYYRANGLVVAPGGYQGEDADVLARAVLTRPNPKACAEVLDDIGRAQDRTTGDSTVFWQQRNYVVRASRVRASVFITHGLNDWNVKTKQFAQWWEALGASGVPRKLWLHPGGHGGSGLEAWRTAVHRWIDHWLYEIDNGIETEPIASVENARGQVLPYANWPDPDAESITFPMSRGTLGIPGPKLTETFVDNGAILTAEKLAAAPLTANPNRLAYLTPPLATATRLSGTPKIELRGSVDNDTAANLTALLVDYGATGGSPKIVSRGWMDVQNRGSNGASQGVEAGKLYWFGFELEPKDYTFPVSHRIGVVIISTDHSYTLRPKPGTQLSIRVDKSTVELPLVAGLPGFLR